MRVAIFIMFFTVAFVIASTRHDGGALWVGTHGFSAYGWPQHWIFVDETTPALEIYPDGARHEVGKHSTSWKIAWQPLFISVGVVAAIAAALSSPLLFLHRFKRHHEPVA